MAPNKGLLIVSTLLCIPLFVYIFIFSGQWLQGVSNGSRDFDVVVFSQNLPLAACAKLHEKSPSNKCLLPADGGWKIRGLAPFFLNKAGPGSCKESLTVNMTRLATIKNQLLMKWPDLYNQTTTWEKRVKFVKMPMSLNNSSTTTMAPTTTETNNFPSTMMAVKNETNNLPTTMMMMMDPENDSPTTMMTPLSEPNDLPTTTTIKFENSPSKIVAESSRVTREISTPATILFSDTESPSETEEPLDSASTNVTDKNLTQQTTTTTTTTVRPSVISKIASKSITANDLTSGVVLTSGAIKTTPAPEIIDGNYFNYWENEWEKRGACGFDNQDEILGYFKKGFSLMEQFDMTAILKKANILPGGEYSVIQISQRIEKVVGARCRVKCFWREETRTSYLLEVSICFDKSMKSPVDCDAVGGSLQNCYIDHYVEYLDRKKFNCIINDNCEKKKWKNDNSK